jgi:hypothetical protein
LQFRSPDSCPEYRLVTSNVVFVIVGKSSNQRIPLAEVIDFRLRKSELAVRVDDAKRESKFAIKKYGGAFGLGAHSTA